jgi:6-pyruvoyltetrahydropterin/6-carboxytetrahydropterin synthase
LLAARSRAKILLWREPDVFELTVETSFSAAHQIVGHPGPCARLHGHNYRVVVTVTGSQLDERGMLIDFARLKEICAGTVDDLDHSFLNELPAFRDVSPTAEALAQHIYLGVAQHLASGEHGDVRVAAVTVYESDRTRATYRE